MLFRSPDPELTRFVCNGIEFRGHKHQSVLPPSFHEDGSKYQWISGSTFTISEMPDELKRFYFQNKRQRLKKIKRTPPKPKLREGFVKTICNRCKNSYPINRTRLLLEVQAFRLHRALWMCRNCRKFDIRDDCRMIRKQNRKPNF